MERGEKIILSSPRRVEARRGLRSLSDVLRCEIPARRASVGVDPLITGSVDAGNSHAVVSFISEGYIYTP